MIKRNAKELLRTAASRNALAWVGLWAALLLSSRLADPSSALANFLFILLTTTLALLTPNLLAIVLEMIASFGGASRDYARADREMEALMREASDIQEEAAKSTERPPLEIVYPPVAALLLAALLSPPMLTAATPEGVLRVMVDQTDSLDSPAFDAAVETIFDALPAIATGGNIRFIELYGFGEDAFAVPAAHVIELPAAPEQQPCERKQSELEWLFREASERARKEQEEGCKQRREAELRAHQEKIAELIRTGKQKLLAHEPAGADRSCVADALARHVYRSAEPLRGLIVLSDGADNCRQGADALRGPPGSIPAALVLAPEGKVEPQRQRQHLWPEIRRQARRVGFGRHGLGAVAPGLAQHAGHQ